MTEKFVAIMRRPLELADTIRRTRRVVVYDDILTSSDWHEERIALDLFAGATPVVLDGVADLQSLFEDMGSLPSGLRCFGRDHRRAPRAP